MGLAEYDYRMLYYAGILHDVGYVAFNNPAVLSDMDTELSALEARRDKTRALKQGMMQQLLTGKTRLFPAGDAHA